MGRTTTIEERVLICELSEVGHTDREIAEQMGWSRWAVRKWRRRGRAGRKALASAIGRPATGILSTFSASIPETLKSWREAHPGWGPKTLRAELETDERFKGQKLPSLRSIAAFLKQEELTGPYERHSDLPQTTRAAMAKAPHELWEMDARGHEQIPDVGVVTLIHLNDRFSRLRLLSYPCLLGKKRWTRSPATEDYQIALRLAFTDWGTCPGLTSTGPAKGYSSGPRGSLLQQRDQVPFSHPNSPMAGELGRLSDLRAQGLPHRPGSDGKQPPVMGQTGAARTDLRRLGQPVSGFASAVKLPQHPPPLCQSGR